MIKHRHILPLFFCIVLLACGISLRARSPRHPRPDSSDALKAEYLFLEAVAAQNDSRIDDAVLLLQRAKKLNPADADIAGTLGELAILTAMGDSAVQAQSYADIRRRFLANPADVDNGLLLAAVAARNFKYADERMAYRLLSQAHPDNTDLAFRRARAMGRALANGDSAAADTALRIYDRLEAGLGADPTLINERVNILALLRDTTAILSEFRKLYASAPSDPDNCLMVGTAFYSLSMPDSAIVYFDRACELDSTRGDAFLTRAGYYQAVGDSARYDTEVFRALESENLDFAPKIQLLTDYVRSLYTDTAYTARINRMFAIMQDIHPGEAELHSLYGIYLSSQDSVARAAEQFGYATDLDPEEESNWRFLMQTEYAAGDTAATIAAGRRAARLFPEMLYFPVSTSAFLSLAGRSEEALALMDSVDLSSVDDPAVLSSFYSGRADILYRLQRPDSAFAEYDRAISLDPSNALALNNAAYYMSLEGKDLARARHLSEAALHEDPLNGTYIDTYAWVLFKQGDYDEARKQIDAVLALITPADSTQTEPSESSEDSESSEIVEAAEEVLPEPLEPSADIYDHAGDIYFMTGDKNAAIDFWRKALLLAPDNAVIRKKIKTGTIVTE